MAEHDLGKMLAEIKSELTIIFEQLDWAADEIARATERHPAERDLIWHSNRLLKPTHPLMRTEFVFRAHCRELIGRVVAGEDTRPGTSVEAINALSEASSLAPLRPNAAGLYFRLWTATFPDKLFEEIRESRDAHETLHRSEIDDLEALTRRKLSVKDRKLGKIECDGMHHGEPVQCKYAETSNEGS
jgi:hypothetical protein